MDPIQASSLTITTLLLLLLAVATWRLLRRRTNSAAAAHPNLPPGPRKLPFIGNMHHLTTFRVVPESSSSSVDYHGSNLEFIPFGAGRRMCPGIAFGIANVELPLASLLYHFDWKSGDGNPLENLDMSERFGATMKKKHDLCLIPIPYKPDNPID